jgi:hypothetical protein
MEEIFTLIESAKTVDVLVDLICADGYGSSERFFRWNLTRLGDKKHCTIEFRQAPVSTRWDDANFWSIFAYAFVFAAVTSQSSIHRPDPTKAATLEHLKEFILHGCFGCGIKAETDLTDVDRLFHGKTKLEEGMFPEVEQPRRTISDVLRSDDMQWLRNNVRSSGREIMNQKIALS